MKIYYDSNEKEIWKLIPNSKGYLVSNFRNVKRAEHKMWSSINNSWSTYKEKQLTICYNNSKGYGRVKILYKDGTGRTESVHRLVAMMFKVNPKPGEYDQVNHLDGNIKNNHWRNLQWCTNQMNMNHSWKYSKKRQMNSGGTAILGINSRKLTIDEVKKIPELLKTHTSAEIARMFNIGASTITEITKGRSWKWLNLKFS